MSTKVMMSFPQSSAGSSPWEVRPQHRSQMEFRAHQPGCRAIILSGVGDLWGIVSWTLWLSLPGLFALVSVAKSHPLASESHFDLLFQTSLTSEFSTEIFHPSALLFCLPQAHPDSQLFYSIDLSKFALFVIIFRCIKKRNMTLFVLSK